MGTNGKTDNDLLKRVSDFIRFKYTSQRSEQVNFKYNISIRSGLCLSLRCEEAGIRCVIYLINVNLLLPFFMQKVKITCRMRVKLRRTSFKLHLQLTPATKWPIQLMIFQRSDSMNGISLVELQVLKKILIDFEKRNHSIFY